MVAERIHLEDRRARWVQGVAGNISEPNSDDKDRKEFKRMYDITGPMRDLVTDKEFVEAFGSLDQGRHGDAVITKKAQQEATKSS